MSSASYYMGNMACWCIGHENVWTFSSHLLDPSEWGWLTVWSLSSHQHSIGNISYVREAPMLWKCNRLFVTAAAAAPPPPPPPPPLPEAQNRR